MHKKQTVFLQILMLICISVSLLFAQTDSQIEQVNSLLSEVRDKIYNFDSNDNAIENNLMQYRAIVASFNDTKQRLYGSANVEYYEGLFWLKKQNKKEAEVHFLKCNAILTQTIKDYANFSDAYSLLADSHMQLMLSKGITYQLLNGQKLKFFPEKALLLDSSNIRAYQSLAVYCMNAPEVLGGGIQKAIGMLLKLSSKDHSEMFRIYYLLGNAYMKVHNSIMASHYLQQALSIYPSNQWAKDDLQTVERNFNKR